MKDISDSATEKADARALLSYAKSYAAAARGLWDSSDGPKRDRHAPYRFCAHHAIEMFLSAFLARHGIAASELEGFRHALIPRANRALEAGLSGPDVETWAHIAKLDKDNEYIGCRYPPNDRAVLSELTRMSKTLHVIEEAVLSQM